MRRDDLWLQRQELEKVAEEKRILIKLPDIFEQRARQAQSLLKGLVEESQVAQGYQTAERLGHHPDEGRARDRERGDPGQQLRRALAASQIEAFAAELLSETLIGGLKVIAQGKEPDFRRGLSRGEQPVVIPGAPLNRRGADAEFVLPDGMAQDDGERRECADQKRYGKPDAKACEHHEHGGERDAIL